MEKRICDYCGEDLKKLHVPMSMTYVYKGFKGNYSHYIEVDKDQARSEDSVFEVCSKKCLLHYLRKNIYA